jgi:hypothetical protein
MDSSLGVRPPDPDIADIVFSPGLHMNIGSILEPQLRAITNQGGYDYEQTQRYFDSCFQSELLSACAVAGNSGRAG